MNGMDITLRWYGYHTKMVWDSAMRRSARYG